jgi:ubiquinone/menaquinone biosynthesis C-methylase UbiE
VSFVQHPVFARFMAWRAARNEQLGQGELRDEQLAGLTGVVIEAGAGSGVSFAHYPVTVTELIAVEPSDYLREQAERAARQARVPVRVVEGTAEKLPAADGSVDAVAVSGMLCSVDDPAAVLAEFRRVLRPGGELRFYEHVRSRDPLLGRLQDTADLVWPKMMGGCHPNRDTLAAIREAGFTVTACRGLVFPPGTRLYVVGSRILGAARSGPAAALSLLRYPLLGHQGLAGTPAHGLGMVGSPIGSGFSTTVPFGVGYLAPGGQAARPVSHSTCGNS